MTNATISPSPITTSLLELESKEGRRFLNRVIRENKKSDWKSEWSICADKSTEWKIVFRRIISPASAGDAERRIEVITDYTLPLPHESGHTRAFSDGESVYIPAVRYVSVLSGGTTSAICRLLLNGYRLAITSSAGSTATSKLGLSWLRLKAFRREDSFAEITIDESLFKDGRPIATGCINA